MSSPPSRGITTAKTVNDVLCGRGGGTNVHPGNIKFRNIVMKHQKDYKAAKKTRKREIGVSIVGQVRQSNGRFLERAYKKGKITCWKEIDEESAIFKACQALRDGSRIYQHHDRKRLPLEDEESDYRSNKRTKKVRQLVIELDEDACPALVANIEKTIMDQISKALNIGSENISVSLVADEFELKKKEQDANGSRGILPLAGFSESNSMMDQETECQDDELHPVSATIKPRANGADVMEGSPLVSSKVMCFEDEPVPATAKPRRAKGADAMEGHPFVSSKLMAYEDELHPVSATAKPRKAKGADVMEGYPFVSSKVMGFDDDDELHTVSATAKPRGAKGADAMEGYPFVSSNVMCLEDEPVSATAKPRRGNGAGVMDGYPFVSSKMIGFENELHPVSATAKPRRTKGAKAKGARVNIEDVMGGYPFVSSKVICFEDVPVSATTKPTRAKGADVMEGYPFVSSKMMGVEDELHPVSAKAKPRRAKGARAKGVRAKGARANIEDVMEGYPFVGSNVMFFEDEPVLATTRPRRAKGGDVMEEYPVVSSKIMGFEDEPMSATDMEARSKGARANCARAKGSSAEIEDDMKGHPFASSKVLCFEDEPVSTTAKPRAKGADVMEGYPLASSKVMCFEDEPWERPELMPLSASDLGMDEITERELLRLVGDCDEEIQEDGLLDNLEVPEDLDDFVLGELDGFKEPCIRNHPSMQLWANAEISSDSPAIASV